MSTGRRDRRKADKARKETRAEMNGSNTKTREEGRETRGGGGTVEKGARLQYGGKMGGRGGREKDGWRR